MTSAGQRTSALVWALIFFFFCFIPLASAAIKSNLKKSHHPAKKSAAVKSKIKTPVIISENKLKLSADTAFIVNSRTQGTISSDQNFDVGLRGSYVFDKLSDLQFQGRVSSAQTLSNQTQAGDLGLIYRLALAGKNKLNVDLGLRPFVDTTSPANTNTEMRLAANYSQPLDDSAKLNYTGMYKSRGWNTSSALNLNVGQLGVNYQKNINEGETFAGEVDYLLQSANTATNVFSDLRTGLVYNKKLFDERKIGVKYGLSNRSYPSNGTATFFKNDIAAAYEYKKFQLDLGLTNYAAPNDSNGSYTNLVIGSRYAQPLSATTKIDARGGLLTRVFGNSNSNYFRINFQAGLDHSLATDQILKLNNLLEDAFYNNASSSYLHNLLTIRYEKLLADAAALVVSERYTLDHYPNAAGQNASRHQIDLNYNWPLPLGMSLLLTGGYELKSFAAPSASQSDYQAYTLAANFDYPFSKEGKVTFVVSNFDKKNAQSATADTIDRNLSLNLVYTF